MQFHFANGLAMSAIEGCVCLPRLFPGLGVGRVCFLQPPEKSSSIGKRIRGLVFLGLLTTLVLPLRASCRREERLNEHQAKASFLAAFPNFVGWPPDAFSAEQSPFLLRVFGEFSCGTSLAQCTRGTSMRGRRLEVRWARKEQDLRAGHILFLSRSEGKRSRSLFKSVQEANVLTVGETSGFLASGGAIDFLISEDKLPCAVNRRAASDAHLRISSNVPSQHVTTRAEAAKS